MDDLLITRTSFSIVIMFKTYVSSYLHMKDLGPLKYFLGIKVARNPSSLYLCQQKYTLKIFSETGLMGAKPTSTPLEPNHQSAKASSPLFAQPDRYRQLIAKLIYLTLIRLGLAYVVHIFCLVYADSADRRCCPSCGTLS